MLNNYKMKMSNCKNVRMEFKIAGITVATIISLYFVCVAFGLLSVTIIFSSSHDIETGCPSNMTKCSYFICSTNTTYIDVKYGIPYTQCGGDRAIYVTCRTGNQGDFWGMCMIVGFISLFVLCCVVSSILIGLWVIIKKFKCCDKKDDNNEISKKDDNDMTKLEDTI